MSDSHNQFMISRYIQEIIVLCEKDNSLLELTTSNFRHLINALELYDRTPEFYNSICADTCDPSAAHSEVQAPKALLRMPHCTGKQILALLEDTAARKLSNKDVMDLATYLSTKSNIELSRQTKRKMQSLYQWLFQHWVVFQPHILSYFYG